jgi:hypothetical protein
VKVRVKGDSTFEPDEDFVVYLSNPVNAVLRDDLGIGTIVDDDWVTTVGPHQSATDEDLLTGLAAPPTTVEGFAGYIDGQSRTFVLTTADNKLFAGETGQPSIDATGTLTFQPAPNMRGTAVVTIVLEDGEGIKTAPHTFSIEITKPHPWHNVLQHLDVTGPNGIPDGVVLPGDALAVINYINGFGIGKIPAGAEAGAPYLDTTGGPGGTADNRVLPGDALAIINFINGFGIGRPGPPLESEGESSMSQQAERFDLLSLLAMDVAVQPKRPKVAPSWAPSGGQVRTQPP